VKKTNIFVPAIKLIIARPNIKNIVIKEASFAGFLP
jgi:hypothetical protein